MFAASKSGSVSEPTDSKFNYVTMLLHGNGTNGAQNNTFVDSSTNNFTITRNGNTTQGTFSPYGSNWSNYFDGSGDYLSIANATPLQLSGSQFTIEGWFYLTVGSTDNVLVCQSSGSADANVNYQIRITSANKLRFLVMSGTSPTYFDGTTTITTNGWHHFACVCDGSGAGAYLRSWVDGVYQGASSSFNASSINTNTAATQIGAWTFSSQYISGYLSNFRILKGTALYTGTSNITVPTSPLTAITNTSLLTCQSNRFIDNSSNAYTITSNGDTSVQRFSPFAPTSAYSTATIGGSGYFDGSGDYLTTPTSGQFAPSGDFTVSFWYYPTNLIDYYSVIGNYTANTSADWLIETSANGTIRFYTNGGTARITSTSGAIVKNQWNYVSMSRSGSTITAYVNGVSQGTYSQSGTFGTTSKAINIAGAASQYTTGYIADVKLIDGSAVTSVPTTPQTATSGTNLLLNFTNAAILDNAMINDLETVGNAQISTSVKKYGTGSLSFDGTDDRLTSATSPNIAFGTGDFTIEAWIYPNVLTGERGIIQTSDTVGGLKTSYTTGVIINLDVSPYRLNCNIGGTNVNSGSTYISASTWTHVAITRASGSVRMFINGTVVGGPTTITTDLTGQNICIGGYYSTSYLWNGYIDDLRITKGYARYTSNFTAPTAAFADRG